MNEAFNILMHATRTVASSFFHDGCKKRVTYIYPEDLVIDDQIIFPKGKIIRIRFDYCKPKNLLK